MQVIEQGLLKLIFEHLAGGGETKEFKHDRIADKLAWTIAKCGKLLARLLFNWFANTARQQPAVIEGPNLPFKCASGPVLISCFVHIPLPGPLIMNRQRFRFVTHCVTN